VEVYPLLPGHIDLLLQITTAMRSRSRRVQGDDQAIRGLLQMLGELFRSQRLADMPQGHWSPAASTSSAQRLDSRPGQHGTYPQQCADDTRVFADRQAVALQADPGHPPMMPAGGNASTIG
jgi:hypothetical protein